MWEPGRGRIRAALWAAAGRARVSGRARNTLIVVVSPHLDDAVISCWSLLTRPDDVQVVTVFAGEPPEGVLGEWDEEGGASDSRERVRERIAEDRAALALAGCGGVYLDFLDEQYEPGQQTLADGLRPHLEGATAVYGPKGATRNDDHLRVREALVGICPGLRYYADLPYSLVEGFELLPGTEANGLAPRDVVLDSAAAGRKVEAVRCYRTQLPQLELHFGDFVTRETLARERTWEPA
jgi:LmbE family N-acetylglucosaminyl deacetylase